MEGTESAVSELSQRTTKDLRKLLRPEFFFDDGDITLKINILGPVRKIKNKNGGLIDSVDSHTVHAQIEVLPIEWCENRNRLSFGYIRRCLINYVFESKI